MQEMWAPAVQAGARPALGSHDWRGLRGGEINQPQRLGEKGGGRGSRVRASAGQSAGAGTSRVTSLPPPALLPRLHAFPQCPGWGIGTVQAWPPMPMKGAVGLAPRFPGSRHRPLPRPAPHLRAAPAAPRSPCARPCSLSVRRILGDAQAWPAEPSAADLIAEPAHRSAGYLTLSLGVGLCPLFLTAPSHTLRS